MGSEFQRYITSNEPLNSYCIGGIAQTAERLKPSLRFFRL